MPKKREPEKKPRLRRPSRRPEPDVNQIAFRVISEATREHNPPEPQKVSITDYLAEIGRKGGLKGGPARAKKLSKKRLSSIGKKAADARWSKRKKTQ